MISFADCAGADCGNVTMTASTNTITLIADFIFGLLSKIKTGADTNALPLNSPDFGTSQRQLEKRRLPQFPGAKEGHDSAFVQVFGRRSDGPSTC